MINHISTSGFSDNVTNLINTSENNKYRNQSGSVIRVIVRFGSAAEKDNLRAVVSMSCYISKEILLVPE